MEVLQSILIFAGGISLGVYLRHRFSKPTTVNEYSGTVKNKVKGRGNVQEVEQTFSIHAGMTRREVIKIWKEARKSVN